MLVLGTVLPMYLLYRGTEKLTFIHTALYRYIQPVVATVLALVRHQEQIDRTNIIAGVLIFASIILVIREANLRGFFSSVRAPSPTPRRSKSKATMTEVLSVFTVSSRRHCAR